MFRIAANNLATSEPILINHNSDIFLFNIILRIIRMIFIRIIKTRKEECISARIFILSVLSVFNNSLAFRAGCHARQGLPSFLGNRLTTQTTVM
ncbi:hypothetical protein Dda3937_02758 [Dickeya dadantii 3937]|uniref:Uncharacterized protein n=1 Tax=Dickeya dadantii (strain 3937) TaxID=198628 RepID=E0SJH5_DICD3|nr:hypothetical protein Dda3937_02758 [Dickeya dadantii 3937]